MIIQIKRRIAATFNKFIMVLTVALLFEPVFHLADSLCDCLRFGENSTLPQKILQLYLVFLCLFNLMSAVMKIPFRHDLIYGYLAQTFILKYIFHRFFMERARVLWSQMVYNIHQNQELIVNTTLLALMLVGVAKTIRVFKVQGESEAKGGMCLQS